MSEITLTDLQRLAWEVANKQVLTGDVTIVGANKDGYPIMRSTMSGFEWQMGDINFGGNKTEEE